MLLLILRLLGQPRPQSLAKRHLPPFHKLKGELEQANLEYLNCRKTIETLRKIQQVYHLENRLFL
jgi:hypothetical protein